MKRISALFGCIFSLLIITAAAVSAEEKDVAAPAPTGIGQLLRLLQDKNVITAEDAAALGKQSALGIDKENMNNLLNLLQGKGVITSEEAANLADNPAGSAKKLPGPAGRNTATVPLVLPMDDRRFVQLLKDKWVDVGKRIDEFYPTFNDSRDPEYIISRMKAAEVITDDEAFELLRQYRTYYLSGAVATSLEAKEKTYLDRISKSVVADLEKNALPKIRNDWTQRLKLSGDLRLRYEADYFDKANGVQMKPDNTSQLLNTTIDRTRSAIRARLGLEAKVTDDITAGIGLATGNSTNPVSTNSAMGDTLNKKNFLVDRAYLNWNPAPALSVWGGRFPNPWFYSDLVWDADINFEGVAVQYHPRLSSSWGLFFNGGIFPIQEVELSGKDKWLFGAQIGAEYQKKGLLTARLGAAIYDFKNTVGVVDPSNSGLTNWSTPQFMQKGNTPMAIDSSTPPKIAYASKFRELNVTGTLDLAMWDPIHVIFLGDYVKNLGFDKGTVSANYGSDVKRETLGYQIGVSVGYPAVRNPWEWKALFYYKYLESDAVMDAFTDSDFNLGGTNAKGWIAGGDLGLAKNVWLSTRWFSSNEISGVPLSIDVLHLNINARF